MNRFYNKKVLITGATGLIGQNLADKLMKNGAKVIAFGRSKQKLEKVFFDGVKTSDIALVEGNIANSFPANDTDIDFIFHAASPISGAEIKTRPVDTISANIDGIKNCLKHLKHQGYGRLILFSSATVYGNFSLAENITVTEEMTDRADALHTPNSPYSESKRMIEVMAKAYRDQYEVDSVITRISYVYGYAYPKPSTAFYEFIEKAVGGEDIVLNKSGMGRRDNIHVDDVINGLLEVAMKGKSGEAYNLSSNGELGNFGAIDEIAEIIAEETGAILKKHIRVQNQSLESARKAGMKMDNKKVKALGWNLNIGLRDGIRKTVSAYCDDFMRQRRD